MRTRIRLLILVFSGLSAAAAAQSPCDSIVHVLSSEKGYRTCLPKTVKNMQVVQHNAYTIGYSEQHEQAAWVCYVLSKNECAGGEKRSSSFFEDADVKTGSACDADYKGCGYDRGHLAPAGDMGYSPATMKESFYYSNMSPQLPAFNRGIWKKLETQVREWGTLYTNCLVITGPVLRDSLKTIGKNGVSVPELYYKIVVNPNTNPPQAIGFLLRNEASTLPLANFVVTIDSIETVSGIDFFSTLPASCQQKLESQVNSSQWKGLETAVVPPTSSRKKKPVH